MSNLPSLLNLAHSVCAPDLEMCILAEGNVSARKDDRSFWVKGSGQSMGSITEGGFSEVSFGPVLGEIDNSSNDDLGLRELLNSARIAGPPPSTEAFMHAALLAIPGIDFVAHGHPTPLLSLLCLEQAREWAGKRLFPDEIVCCGPEACFVPYVAPGLQLAKAILTARGNFRVRLGIEPKTYWLQNHGLIAVGATANEVLAACQMSVKAARVLLGAVQTGGPIRFLTEDEVGHIYHWPDEHARQRALWSAG